MGRTWRGLLGDLPRARTGLSGGGASLLRASGFVGVGRWRARSHQREGCALQVREQPPYADGAALGDLDLDPAGRGHADLDWTRALLLAHLRDLRRHHSLLDAHQAHLILFAVVFPT